MKVSINLINQPDRVVATCPELEINCYGCSRSQALSRMKQVITFYMESAQELGLNIDRVTEIETDALPEVLSVSCTNSTPVIH